MIALHRLNNQILVVNAAHIVTIEATPDTLLTLMNDEKILVRESAEEVITKATYYFRSLGNGAQFVAVSANTDMNLGQ